MGFFLVVFVVVVSASECLCSRNAVSGSGTKLTGGWRPSRAENEGLQTSFVLHISLLGSV